nr:MULTISPECIES: transglutaminase domain-containing protein [unclassified Ruminococcus]
MSTLLAALAFALIKTAKQALAACAAAFAFLVMFLLLEADSLINQFEYVINSAFFDFSKYIPVPQSVSIGTHKEYDATILLAFVECALIFLFTFCIVKKKTTVPVVIISVLLVAPCFILISTCPNLLPLFLSIAAISVLLLTSELRRYGVAHCAAVSSAAFATVMCILALVYIAYPADSFKREPWQDKLLLDLRHRAGLEFVGEQPQQNGAGEGTTDVKRIDLGNAEAPKQTHEVVMQVYNDDSEQTIYLRGTAYANYDKNKWSTLNEQQYSLCPSTGAWNPFYSFSGAGGDMSMKIVTKNKEDVVYFPYFLSQKPIGVSQNADISLNNQEGKTSYTLDYRTYPVLVDLSVDSIEKNSYEEYADFVYQNYTQISDELCKELQEIGGKYDIDKVIDDSLNQALSSYYVPDSDMDMPIYPQSVAQAIQEIVSSSAEYSLETQGIPDGEDIASYLLKEDGGMETAYCVHFATAAVMMLRAYGIPSRYVTGYYVKTSSETPYTTVTTDNAHAWAEYFVDGIGWTPLEATPPSFTPSSPVADPIEEKTEPTEIQTETNQAEIQPTSSEVSSDNNSDDNSGLIMWAIVVSVAAALLIVSLRVLLIRALRRKRFISGGKSKRAVYIYRYIKRCEACAKKSIPQEIYDIGAKASFSQHSVTSEELNTLQNYAEKARGELYKAAPAIKRFYYAVIAVL